MTDSGELSYLRLSEKPYFSIFQLYGLNSTWRSIMVESLSPLHNIHIGLSLIVFVALSAALVSALPITPGGLGGCGVCHCGRAGAGWGGCGRGGGDCHTGQGHKLLGIDGGGGCGVYNEREEVVANRRVWQRRTSHCYEILGGASCTMSGTHVGWRFFTDTVPAILNILLRK